MPNDCMNKLVIIGPCADVENFVAKSPDKFNFESYLPTPDALKSVTYPTNAAEMTDEESQELKKLYKYDNWYEWRLNNWGTKWVPYGDTEWEPITEYKSRNESVAWVFFDTAWSPPIEFLERISEQYSTIKFILKFAEPGCDFAGHVEIKQRDVEVIAEGEYVSKDTLYILDTLGLWDDVEAQFYNFALEILEEEEPHAPEGLEEEFKRWCLERVLAHSHPPQTVKENFKDLVQQAVDTYADHP